MSLSVSAARFRLAVFWVAVFALALGENAVRGYALVQMSNGAREFLVGFLLLWLGLSAVPAFALAPLVGALASSRFRNPVMVASAIVGIAAVAWFSLDEYRNGQTFWVGCLAILATASAFFGPCRFAVIPDAVRKAELWLPQVVGLFAVAVGAGTGLGIYTGVTETATGKPGMALPLQLAHVAYGVALVCLVFGRFPVQNAVPIAKGLVGPFLRATGSIFHTRNGRNSLLFLWVAFAVGLTVSQYLAPGNFPWFLLLCVGGMVLGSLQPNAFRTMGIIPYAALGLAVCAIWSWRAEDWNPVYFGVAGFLGLMLPGLLTTFAIYQPEETRGQGWALLAAGCSLITGGFLAILVAHLQNPADVRPLHSWIVVGLSIVMAVAAWLVFFHPTFEFTFEVLLWPNYRVRAVGPGVHKLPWRGPVLIIANHGAWFDPLWMNKILPFPVKPMMTSRFYDLPGLGWVFRKVINAIRVEDTRARKEAPELELGIAALKNGDCLIVFPEGWLRRKEEQEMRRFARGVWHLLSAVPDTPVFPCWIEGNWSSMWSHRGGPPMKGKKVDWFHKITIAVGNPVTLGKDVLEKHMKTRVELMKRVLDARSVLGLPPYDPFTLPEKGEETEEEPA